MCQTIIEKMRSAVSFDEDSHIYTVNGKVFPSVTTVIPKQKFFMSPENLESYRLEGVENHKRLEEYFNCKTKKGNSAIDGFISQHPEFGKFIGSEVLLWSKLGYAGTADLLFENAVVDLKRSVGNKKIHALQLAGYHRAAFEHGLINRNKNHYIIIIGKNGKLIQKNVWNMFADNIFQCCLKYYNVTELAESEKLYEIIIKYLES
jgi:hypothetical protein